jgi:EmrB/QacA subfamily drug resistance transporter
MGAVLIGTFMVALDQTIVTIALPQIGLELHQTSGVDWVITAYLLAVGVVQPATGWLADRVGRKAVFLSSLAIFTIGSLLSALAPDLPILVLTRILQGLGGGAIFPVGMAMVYEQFPPDRRGMAMGIWSLGIIAAPALGPVLGGFIVTAWSWRLLFLINVPIGLIGLLVGSRVLRFAGFHERRAFDGRGFGLVAVGLGAGLLALSGANGWGWTSPLTLLLSAGAIALVGLFAHHELGHPEPLIDVRMFRIPAFTISLTVIGGLVIAQFARLVFIPLELEVLRHMTALEAGLVLTPAALAAAVAAPLAGRVTDRIGARPPVMLGLAISAIGAWLLAGLRLDTPISVVVAVVTFQGLGNGMAMTPNTVAGLNALPQALLARGSAIRSSARQVAASLGVATLTALVVAQAGDLTSGSGAAAATVQAAYGVAFLVSSGVLVLCLGLAIFLPGARQTHAHQAERAVEHEQLLATSGPASRSAMGDGAGPRD